MSRHGVVPPTVSLPSPPVSAIGVKPGCRTRRPRALAFTVVDSANVAEAVRTPTNRFRRRPIPHYRRTAILRLIWRPPAPRVAVVTLRCPLSFLDPDGQSVAVPSPASGPFGRPNRWSVSRPFFQEDCRYSVGDSRPYPCARSVRSTAPRLLRAGRRENRQHRSRIQRSLLIRPCFCR